MGRKRSNGILGLEHQKLRLMLCLLAEKQKCIVGMLADSFLVSEREIMRLF